jgi:hypothetical protein
MSMFHKLFEWFSHVTARDDECFSVQVKKGDSLWANPDRKWSADYVVQPGETLHVPHSWAE